MQSLNVGIFQDTTLDLTLFHSILSAEAVISRPKSSMTTSMQRLPNICFRSPNTLHFEVLSLRIQLPVISQRHFNLLKTSIFLPLNLVLYPEFQSQQAAPSSMKLQKPGMQKSSFRLPFSRTLHAQSTTTICRFYLQIAFQPVHFYCTNLDQATVHLHLSYCDWNS